MDFAFNICYAIWLMGAESLMLSWKLPVLNWHEYSKKNAVMFHGKNFDLYSVSVFLFYMWYLFLCLLILLVTGDICLNFWHIFFCLVIALWEYIGPNSVQHHTGIAWGCWVGRWSLAALREHCQENHPVGGLCGNAKPICYPSIISGLVVVVLHVVSEIQYFPFPLHFFVFPLCVYKMKLLETNKA